MATNTTTQAGTTHHAGSIADGTLKGYPKAARLMEQFPDAAIFRKFTALTAFQLMSLQAELLDLEDQLWQTCKDDDASQDEKTRKRTRQFFTLHKSRAPDDDQLKLLRRSRQKVQEYCASKSTPEIRAIETRSWKCANAAAPDSLLLKGAQVQGLQPPLEENLRFLRDRLDEESVQDKDGPVFLAALERFTWHYSDTHEYVSLVRNLDADSEMADVKKWLSPKLIDWYHELWGIKHQSSSSVEQAPGWEGVRVYNNETLKKFRFLFKLTATILASLTPAVTILILYYVRTTISRIGITIALTAAFGLILAFCTAANMKEVFASTTALAAVEVVFIGSTTTNTTA
ncbi:hypothetical protein HRR78_002105 [Exophiala dermatitidis]|nr:hypothetical protein HRR78_002105 [Exophiala dermatitidis]